MNWHKNKISAVSIRKHIRKITSSAATLFVVVVLVLFYGLSDAYAVPSFARQTGMQCAACHVGSFGPQLTAVGRNFKLYGYTLGNAPQSAKDYLKNFSAMTFGGFVYTDGDQRKGIELTGSEARFNTNNNVLIDQTSVFYGGTLFPHVGMLAQVTYSNPDEQLAWDNTDIRFANDTKLGSKTLIYGITVNNNPSVQDVWQTTPAWGFPYLSSALMPTPTASPYITQLAGTVGGAGVYGMWDGWLYAELTGYTTLPDRTQQTLGITGADQSDHLSNLAPYWRVALQHDFGAHYVEVGTYGMYADRYPDNMRGFGTDNFLDYAVDASYQFTSENGKHNVSAYASALREHENLAATFASGGSANPTDSLTTLRANVSYYYNNTYGLTFGPFSTTGSADATLYANPTNNKPDTTGWTLQGDYTPFGTADSFGYPYLNVRFFVQYTAYDKFNGLSSNYDGTGRNASDNNTLFTGMWLAF